MQQQNKQGIADDTNTVPSCFKVVENAKCKGCGGGVEMGGGAVGFWGGGLKFLESALFSS